MGSVALRANVGSEEYNVKEFLKIYTDMAVHKSNGLISCSFVKDWLNSGGVKNSRSSLYFLS